MEWLLAGGALRFQLQRLLQRRGCRHGVKGGFGGLASSRAIVPVGIAFDPATPSGIISRRQMGSSDARLNHSNLCATPGGS